MDEAEHDLHEKIARLKTTRETLGWSQERCAHELGVTFSSLNRWERGEALPRSEAILRAIDAWLLRHEHTRTQGGERHAR